MARRVTLALLIAAAAFLAITHGSDIAAFVATARGGSLGWLGIAAVLQVCYYAGYVLTYRQAFAGVGIKRRFLDLAPVMLASVFVNTVTPSAGTAGPALIVDDTTRRGHEPGAAAAGVIIGEFVDLAGFAVVMAVGFTFLALTGRISSLEVLAAVAFLALVAALGSAIALARLRPHALTRLLLALERAGSRVVALFRRPAPRPWAERVSAEFSSAVLLSSERTGVIVSAWLIAVVGHAFDLACFVAVGYAFGFTAIGALVAGYAIGTLVWVTSIVPQGVGIVEGSVAVLLASLGAPPPSAAAISLTFRGLTFWLPFLAGFALLPRVSTFRRPERDFLADEFPAKAAAVLVFAVGAIDILSASTPAIKSRLALIEPLLPFGMNVGNLTAVLAGVALIMLARGLWHHKRAAFLLTVALLAISAVSHIVKGLDYEEAIVSIASMIWLLSEGSAFYAKPDGPSVRQGFRVLLGAFIVTVAYGTLGFWMLARHYAETFGVRDAARQTAIMFTEFTNPGLEPTVGFGRYLAGSIYVVAAVTFGFALIMLLRPVIIRRPATVAESARARGIVEAHGASSLAALALLPDKTYWFSDGGSVVAYTLSGDVAVTLGDPIGPADDLAVAARDFVEFARRNGWRPAFYETTDGAEPGYREIRFDAVCIGFEAVVDVSEFSLSGKSRKTMRNTMNSLANDGYTAEVLPKPQSARTLQQLRDVSDVWLAMVGGSEKRFSLGWFDDAYIGGSDVMVVRSDRGTIVAFANLISEYHKNECTIDLMRRRPEAPQGVMDFLFVKLIEWARDQGYEGFNMGLSPLAGLGEDPEHGITERFLRLVYEHGNALYGFRGLHEYKEKFHPDWEPRYLVYPDAATLPAVFAAVARVNSGEHMLRGYFERVLSRPRLSEPSASPSAPQA